ncbi:bifunctional phosphopantothenoylcysteine decarboxylase/phosphopantothenate--cysteine ligase CoaBC [Leptospirillum sp. Group II 'CF-1']|nr:bifunctional phosphopantothenoylcysteine decarboxylase/phosphopantothenate--cysteine ligase CoaBC [Leptospirillum sp. Group II 'CF-1']
MKPRTRTPRIDLSMCRKILLGITGSIAAYKALELIRLLRQDGHDVQVVATKSALHFFPVLTAEVFSGHPVYSDLFDPACSVRHIELARDADALLIAPASADFLSKMALGLADDLLSTLCLAVTCPVLVAPAMEENMYVHPAIREHRITLAARGVFEIAPETGPLASGKEGLGRFASLETIRHSLKTKLLENGSWSGVRVLVSAGPTYEPIDPVRFLGNRSSGKMGYALAAASAARGADVTLISGPTSLPPPPGVDVRRIETAEDLANSMSKMFPEHDICFMAAAVSDYRPDRPHPSKKKKDGTSWTLSLLENPDILASLSRQKSPGQFLVGFAAESEMNPEKLLEKLRKKGADMLLANDISRPDIGFSSDENEITLFYPDGTSLPLGKHSKTVLSNKILDEIEKVWRRPAASTKGNKEQPNEIAPLSD